MKLFLVCCCLISLTCTTWAAPKPGQPANSVTPAPAVKPSPSPDIDSPDVGSHPIWVADETPKTVTWVEIHYTKETQATGIAHVSIYLRRKNPRSDPLWVCHHLAITKEALGRSLIRPVKQLGYYPEAFDTGYHYWQEEQKKGTAFVCTTTIADYVKTHRPPASPAPQASRTPVSH